MKKKKLKNTFENYSPKKVSYILITKNRARSLEKTLKLTQKLKKNQDELIIIDGASEDNTLGVIKKYAQLIDIFVSEEDQGIGHANNKGILLARGKYIKNLTDDDQVYPEAMEKAIQILENNPEVDILVCGGTKQHGKYYRPVYLLEGTNYGKSVEDVIKYGACGTGFVIRRRSFAIGGLYPNSPAADNNFIVTSIALGLNVKFCRINLYNHPIYPYSTIITSMEEHQKDFSETLKKYASKKIYYKYLLGKMYAEFWEYVDKLYKYFPISQVLLTPARLIFKTIIKKKNVDNKIPVFTDIKSVNSSKKFIWDGGFS